MIIYAQDYSHWQHNWVSTRSNWNLSPVKYWSNRIKEFGWEKQEIPKIQALWHCEHPLNLSKLPVKPVSEDHSSSGTVEVLSRPWAEWIEDHWALAEMTCTDFSELISLSRGDSSFR